MTEIQREQLVDSINSKNVIAESIISCPKSIQDYICDKENFSFDKHNSICLYDKDTNAVCGYILTILSNIPNSEYVFKENYRIVEYLTTSNGLYIIKVVLDDNLNNNLLTYLLNILHLTYCDANLKDNTKYIWSDRGSVIFAPTKQKDKFCLNGINIVSKAFYSMLYKTTLNADTIL